MKRVDQIIRYLSGELTPEESRAFERELPVNEELREEYDLVSAAYRLIGDELRRRDEEAFRSKLREVMDRGMPPAERGSGKRKSWWYLLIPAAASVAVVLAITILNRGNDKIYEAFFDPARDPVILALNQETRGDSGSALAIYCQGNYQAAMEKAASALSQDPSDRLALLIRLLAALELNLEQEALVQVEAAGTGAEDLLGQSLTWYHALALVKSGQSMEASALLGPLLEHPGPYYPDAHKLQKMLLK